jgi:hypothetical protein
MARGGKVDDAAEERAEGEMPPKRGRKFSAKEEAAEDLPPTKKAKGGKIKHRRPMGSKKEAKPKAPVPMPPDDEMDAPPPTGPAMAGPPMGPSPMAPPPPGPPPPGMNQGGSCDKMAAGGVAKVRRGFPKTLSKPKKFKSGGSVRGCGVATKGKNFSGVY